MKKKILFSINFQLVYSKQWKNVASQIKVNFSAELRYAACVNFCG